MIIVDTHCDTLMALAEPDNRFTNGRPAHITPERLREGGVTLQVCALFAGPSGPKGQGKDAPHEQAAAQLKALPMLLTDGLTQVDSPFEALEGNPHVMLSIEGGEIIGDSLDTLRRYRRLGIRLFALTWNNENLLAHPHCADGHKGLKPFGWDVVSELARLGIAADVSHLGEGGFWDLIFHAEKPPMASHSCCRKLCNHTRNLTDDQIRALIDVGGWIGVNFYASFLSESGEADLDTLIRHIAHIGELGGILNVGFGSDFDGIDTPPKELEHPGKLPALLQALLRHGFSKEEVEGIAGNNFLRYMKQFEEGYHG
ncbi:MAG: dipeptidase [Clostridia bacterium]|nr:dipeptidase [Clostridia bacterium]